MFLSKYQINIKDYSQMPELAFSCFLCGKCRRVCPVDLDGRQLSLDLRRQLIDDGHNLHKNGYTSVIVEKKNYLFKNYRHAHTKTVLFPGCNFTAYYPKTTEALSRKFEEDFGISTAYDCCGKPIGELGLKDDEQVIIDRLNQRFDKLGIEEIVVLCPNCYYHLKDRLSVKITTIYEKMTELKMIEQVDMADMTVFPPCPDRTSKEIFGSITDMMPQNQLNMLEGIQCCGAGGCAAVREPDLAKGLRDQFLSGNHEKIYTYCATCSGMIAKSGARVEHIVCKLLSITEEPPKGIASLFNRAIHKVRL